MSPVFDDVLGHAAICDILSRVAAHPGQAYLFHGPRGVGKCLVAERFAALLLYAPAELAMLDRQRLASRLQAHPDFIRLEREEGAREYTVRQVRELLHRVSLSSARGGKMVVLIEDADTLNEESCNALLKTVEEPPAHIVFFFLAERLERLPATLRSRLAPLTFSRVPRREIEDWLKTKHEVTKPGLVAEAAHGCPGRAFAILEDLAGWQTRQERTNAIAEQLLHGALGKRLSAIERLVQEAERAEDPSLAWQELLTQSARAIQNDWLAHPLETLRMARGLIHASRLVGGSLSPRFALEWNGTLPFAPRHIIPRSLDSSCLFSL